MFGMFATIQRGVARSRAALAQVRGAATHGVSLARAVAFWLAVTLPIVYIPLLFVEATWSVAAVTVLLAVHVLCVSAGSGHDPDL